MHDDDCSERPVRRIPKREGLDVSPISATGLLDADEVAQRLRVTPRMVRRLWERRELLAVKIGRHVRFTEAEVQRFIREHSAGGAA